jgi:hypothetical protein
MIRQSTGGGGRKKWCERDAHRLPTSSRRSELAADVFEDEIDPADFFDPEDLGIRRPDSEVLRA